LSLTQDLPFCPYWSDSGVDDEQLSLTQDLPFCPYWSDSGVDDEQVSLIQDLPFCPYWTSHKTYLSVLMLMTHAPETGARKLASVSGASVIQSGAEFFWHQILELDRTCSILRQNLATT